MEHQRQPAAGTAKDDGIVSLLNRAADHHRADRLEEAERDYRTVLAIDPRQPDGLQLMGVLSHMRGDSTGAVRLLRKALRIAPRHAAAHDNLARVLRETGNFREALRHHKRAMVLDPAPAFPYANMAKSLVEAGLGEAADEAIQEAITRLPGNGEFYYYRGVLLVSLGRRDEAVTCLEAAVLRGADEASVYLANLLLINNERGSALEILERWCAAAPDNPIARHAMAAFSGKAPARASDDYVRTVFDRFAASFDVALARLDYQAPLLIDSLLDQTLPVADGSLDVVDVGCGTGLCGHFLRRRARHLTGVDLSAKMLNRARYRKLYDELVQQELTEFLSSHGGQFDLAVAADVLCYFGDLRDMFAAAFRALRPAGRLIFTVEKETGTEEETGDEKETGDASDGYAIRLHGRYSHTERYVMNSLKTCGFTDITAVTTVLRKERGEDVIGMLVSAIHPPA